MGTPEFGATILRRLAQNYEISGVVTQPDRPSGRKNQLTPPAVKIAAQELGLPVLQVEQLRSAEVQAELRQFAQGADVFIVASFGMILPGAVLEMPRLKCINVHASLLPAYRGASPVAQAILDGLPETGVTIMRMGKGLDTGPMLSKVVVPIALDETQATLMDKLALAGAELLVQTLPDWAEGKIKSQLQNHAEATHTGIISKEAGRINWQESAALIERKSRAYDPWPGIYTIWNEQMLKIGRCEVYQAAELVLAEPAEQPGEALTAHVAASPKTERLVIATGEGYLAPLQLQLPGKKMLPVSDFLRGYRQIIHSKL